MSTPYARWAVFALGAFALALALQASAHMGLAVWMALCAALTWYWPRGTGWIAPALLLINAALMAIGFDVLHVDPTSRTAEVPGVLAMIALSLLALVYTRRRNVALCSALSLGAFALLALVGSLVPQAWLVDEEHTARLADLERTLRFAVASEPFRRAQRLVSLPTVHDAAGLDFEAAAPQLLTLSEQWLEFGGQRTTLEQLHPEPSEQPLYLAIDQDVRVARVREVLARFPARTKLLMTAGTGGVLIPQPPAGAQEFARAWENAADVSSKARLLGRELSERALLCPTMRAPLSAWREETHRTPSALTRVVVDGLNGCPRRGIDLDALGYVVMKPMGADFPLPDMIELSLPEGHNEQTLQQLLSER